MNSSRAGPLYSLLAAVSFGIAAPFSKLLLPGVDPLVLAGILYLGGGVVFTVASSLQRDRKEARLRRSDAPLLAAVIGAGGLMAPVLLLLGLQRLDAVSSSLLLNLEAPLTIGLALALFHEHLGRREVAGAAAILGGAVLLSGWGSGPRHVDVLGVLAVTGACLGWALDNNLMQRLSTRDPLQVVQVKALAAGGCNLLLGLAFGGRLPPSRVAVPAFLLGTVSYGVSILLATYALRLLGAARQAAYFSTAPFVGVLASVVVLGESLSSRQLAAGVLMLVGVFILAGARHSHAHRHTAISHDHIHFHDEHHQHAHEGPVVEPHSHEHHHAELVHTHDHNSDLHHRHSHS